MLPVYIHTGICQSIVNRNSDIWNLFNKQIIILIACTASVSVQFWSKERGTRIKDRAKMGQVKERGSGGEEKKETFPQIPLPPLSFSRSRSIFRAAKTENPSPRRSLFFMAPKPHGNNCYAGYHTDERVFLYFSL